MSTARLVVVSAGPSTSIQDLGRVGSLRYGAPASGPLDRWAHTIALAAVGASADAPAVEVGPGGIHLRCVGAPLSVAVAGGGAHVVHRRSGADAQVGPWCVATLSAGDELLVRAGTWGRWATVAVAGRFDAGSWWGSASTHVASGLGGGVLATGDSIVVRYPVARPDHDGPLRVDDDARPVEAVRVVLGPQQRHFPDEGVDTLLGDAFQATSAADRMGMRLDGPRLPVAESLSIPSEAITRGSLQVDGNGRVTVQLADHLTVGGYPKIATVIGADLDRVAQLDPGSTLRFVAITPADAVLAARDRQQRLSDAIAVAARTDRSLEQRLRRSNLVSGVVSGGEAESERDENS